MFSACVTAVKGRPVQHHCVVIFVWSLGFIDCIFDIKKSSTYAQGGVSGVALFIFVKEQLQ